MQLSLKYYESCPSVKQFPTMDSTHISLMANDAKHLDGPYWSILWLFSENQLLVLLIFSI
jgi:hypothetical protein